MEQGGAHAQRKGPYTSVRAVMERGGDSPQRQCAKKRVDTRVLVAMVSDATQPSAMAETSPTDT